jgi:hypothetical protein
MGSAKNPLKNPSRNSRTVFLQKLHVNTEINPSKNPCCQQRFSIQKSIHKPTQNPFTNPCSQQRSSSENPCRQQRQPIQTSMQSAEVTHPKIHAVSRGMYVGGIGWAAKFFVPLGVALGVGRRGLRETKDSIPKKAKVMNKTIVFFHPALLPLGSR